MFQLPTSGPAGVVGQLSALDSAASLGNSRLHALYRKEPESQVAGYLPDRLDLKQHVQLMCFSDGSASGRQWPERSLPLILTGRSMLMEILRHGHIEP